MAVSAYRCAAAEDRAHVDHAALADDGSNIDDRAHHDDGALADRDLLADDGARLDAGGDVLEVEHGDGAVAAVVFNHDVGDLLTVGRKDRAKLAPVAEDDLVARAEDLRGAVIDRRVFFDIEFHRRLFFGLRDILDDLLCVHCASSLLMRSCIV